MPQATLMLIALLPITSLSEQNGAAPVRADSNGDGRVSYADAAMVRAHFGGAARYDVDASGKVDDQDVAAVLTRLDRPITTLGYRPVRKVHAHLRTWNGSWQRNPLGLASWWALDQPHGKAVQKLYSKIDLLAARAGVRHFVLQLPGGSVPPRMCASQFWPMPKERRELLKQMARILKRKYPDLKLGVYCGWELDPTPQTTEMIGWRYPDWFNQRDRAAMVNQYRGWHDIDFDFLVLDAITQQGWRDGTALTWLDYIERKCHLRTIGEAYPLMKPGRVRVNDKLAMNQHAWMALKRYIDRRKIKGDPVAARYMGLNGHIPGWRESQVSRLRIVSECVAQGFIPWIYDYGTTEESVQLYKYAVDRLASKERD